MLRFRNATIVAFFIVMLLLGQSAAQVNANEQQPRWDLGVFAAIGTGEEATNSFSEAQILTAGIFVGRLLNNQPGPGWYHGRWEYGFDVAPLFVQFSPDRIHGIAFDPIIFRWHPNIGVHRAAPFLELGGGAVRTTANFPSGDTSSFNFTARGGGGVQIATARRQAIEFACRWWHISNANLGTRNPEFNGIQVSIGYHWLK